MSNQDRKRGDLDQFHASFGQLADRFEPRADTRMEEQDLPRAELAEDRAAREQVSSGPEARPDWVFLPDHEVKDQFNAEAQNLEAAEPHQGIASKQVGDDQPELKPAPPQDSADQDRITHAEKMAADDSAAKESSMAAYRAFIEREAQATQGQAEGYRPQTYEQSHDFDQSR